MFSANDKGGLIHDVFKLACERIIEPTLPLDLVRYMNKEDHLIPFSMLRSKSECLSTTLQDKKVKAKYMVRFSLNNLSNTNTKGKIRFCSNYSTKSL